MTSTIILGIESSCDDTGIALVKSDKTILANVVVSQLKEHAPYRGVVPEIASRAHMKNIEAATHEALSQSGMTLKDIDAIAVTAGPGLIGGVIVGTMFAKGLASVMKKPIIAVNHLEGHALTARLTSDVEFPYLLLLVSGGHCQFIAALGVGQYKILGETLDDAVGEAFDKCAKMLGLGYPGGPAIEKIAKAGDPLAYKLPFSMTDRPGCDMSFSGLKTAVRQLAEKELSQANHYEKSLTPLSSFEKETIYTPSDVTITKARELSDLKKKSDQILHDYPLGFVDPVICEGATKNTLQQSCAEANVSGGIIANICASFQYTIGEILAARLENAIKEFEVYAAGKRRSLVISGGVAANLYLRERLLKVTTSNSFEIIAPPISLCTDNAAMIAFAGLERFRLGQVNDLGFCPKARWSLEELALTMPGT